MTAVDRLVARGRRLEWLTVLWNCGEAVVTTALGLAAGSLALLAFGLDSLIEVFASMVVLWQMAGDSEAREERALRLVGWAFAILAAYLVVSSAWSLAASQEPGPSPWGIAYLSTAATAMFGLAALKYRVARGIGSESFRAEAAVTVLDGCLATSVLLALVLNAVLGWWWADPAAALLVAAASAVEARRSWTRVRPVPLGLSPLSFGPGRQGISSEDVTSQGARR